MAVAAHIVPYLAVGIPGLQDGADALLFVAHASDGIEVFDTQYQPVLTNIVLLQIIDDHTLGSGDLGLELLKLPLLVQLQDTLVVLGHQLSLKPIDIQDVVVVLVINPDDCDSCVVSVFFQ